MGPGNFFYHAHGREQCAPHHCREDEVPVLRLAKVVPLHMRKAFCALVLQGGALGGKKRSASEGLSQW